MQVLDQDSIDTGCLANAVIVPGTSALCVQSRPDADTVKAMGKMIKQEGEGTRMAIRAARRAALEQVKRMPSKDAQRQEEKKVRAYLSCNPREDQGLPLMSSHALNVQTVIACFSHRVLTGLSGVI